MSEHVNKDVLSDLQIDGVSDTANMLLSYYFSLVIILWLNWIKYIVFNH